MAGHDPGAVRDSVDADIRYVLDNFPSKPNHNLQMVDLIRPTIFPVASPEYLRSLATPVLRRSSLFDLSLIEEVDGTEWNAWFAAQSLPSLPHGRSGGRFEQAQLTIAAARAGRGVALGNHYLVHDDLKAGTLKIVQPLEEPLLPVQLGTYRFQCKRALWDTPELRMFRNWLQKAISADQADKWPHSTAQ